MGRLVEQIRADYERLEPGEADAWNPVGFKYQLGYRLNLFYALTRALEAARRPLSQLRVLDLGCGNGRSARMYLDLGLEPEQICGLDLRIGALARARRLNPALRWELQEADDLPVGHNWLSATTVFSSIATPGARRELAERIAASVPSGGHVFYYDARKANDFAGGDPIGARELFGGLDIVWARRLGRFSSLPLKDRLRGLLATSLRGDGRNASAREMIGDALAPSVDALLLRKP